MGRSRRKDRRARRACVGKGKPGIRGTWQRCEVHRPGGGYCRPQRTHACEERSGQPERCPAPAVIVQRYVQASPVLFNGILSFETPSAQSPWTKALPLLWISQEVCARRSPTGGGERGFRAQTDVCAMPAERGGYLPHESLGRMSKVCYGVFDEALCERPAMAIGRPGCVPTAVPGCARRTLERRT